MEKEKATITEEVYNDLIDQIKNQSGFNPLEGIDNEFDVYVVNDKGELTRQISFVKK